MDKRCFEHDHHFDERELYDEFTGEPVPDQGSAKCTRCGISIHDSLKAILAECKQMMKGCIQ